MGEDVGRGAVHVREDAMEHGGGAHVRHEDDNRLLIASVPLPAVPAAVPTPPPYPVGRELPATLSYDNPTVRDAEGSYRAGACASWPATSPTPTRPGGPGGAPPLPHAELLRLHHGLEFSRLRPQLHLPLLQPQLPEGLEALPPSAAPSCSPSIMDSSSSAYNRSFISLSSRRSSQRA